jgi:phosphoglycolate phosphatase
MNAVIFDLDGTLIDSLADIGSAMNRTLERHGLPTHSLAAYRTFVGEGVEKLTERALPADRQELKERIALDYRRDYAAHALGETKLYPGIPAMLDALSARGNRLAILSNKPHEPTQALVKSLLSRWQFDMALGERPSVERKPHPRAALEIAQALQKSPGECYFVGDTAIDMRTAVAAKMTPVGVLWGFRGRNELLGAGAAHLLEEPSGLLGLTA